MVASRDMAFSASLVDASDSDCLAMLITGWRNPGTDTPVLGLYCRYSIALMPTNDMRYTENETDERQNRKMSGYSTKQPDLNC